MSATYADLRKDLTRRMDTAVEVLRKEFAGLRTGRASTSLLEPVMVEAYGSSVPISSVGTISVPEARMITVQVWDKALVKAVEKAIREAGLGLNPSPDGLTVRVPIPALNEERRTEITKIASKYSEQAKISVRNVRRDGMESLKRLEKDGDISQDQHRQYSTEIQTLTDERIKRIDEAFVSKEKEIMQV
ncbi:MAG: ribosome recycling factor [Alphaproteobacteria bacterium]|nr:ribosome recycling factor [Alphaproteobacteria bacterium]